VKERLLKIAKWVAYPAFYVFCLGLFGYLAFPVNRLKDRIISEFERHSKPGQRLEIAHISTYWFTGVEVSGVKLTLPPDDSAGPMGGMAIPRSGDELASAGAPKESTITIDEAHVRVRILPLLIGRVRINFWASALGGEIEGKAPIGGSGGDVELELTKVDVGKIEPLVHMLGVPIKGLATGKLELSAVDGKFNKANGSLDLSVEGIAIGDGKAKLAGMIELPKAALGTLTIAGEAKDGVLKVTKLSATGTDVELIGDGRVAIREPWNDANVDLYLKFKFTDAYRNKSETTKSLLGEPGSALPGLIEIQVPKMKRAKRSDGFYGWHVYGPLKRLKFDPSSVDVVPGALPSGASSGKGRGKGPDWRKPPSVSLPGAGAKGDDESAGAPPSPPPPPPPPRPAATEEGIKLPDAAPAPPPQQQPPSRPTPEAPAEQPPPGRMPAQPSPMPPGGLVQPNSMPGPTPDGPAPAPTQ